VERNEAMIDKQQAGPNPTPVPTAIDILNLLAAVAEVGRSTLRGRRTSPKLAALRRAAILLLRSEAGLNGAEIARVFGRTRQWTSLHSRRADEPHEVQRATELVEEVRVWLASGVDPNILWVRSAR
jgi:predicted transcriptional regulator